MTAAEILAIVSSGDVASLDIILDDGTPESVTGVICQIHENALWVRDHLDADWFIPSGQIVRIET